MANKTKTRAEAIEYLRDVLGMNPMNCSAEIVARRTGFLGIRKEEKVESAQQQSERRQRARQLIDNLRQQFWTISADQLRSQLNAIKVRDFPEMQPAVDRLRLVSAFRNEFDRLNKHPRTHKHLFFHFKRVMMLPPREAGSVKEKFLRQVADGGSLKEIKAMVKMMKKEFPELYKVEADWLNSVAKTKDRSISNSADAGEGVSVEFGIPGWLIWLLVIVVIRVLMAIAR